MIHQISWSIIYGAKKQLRTRRWEHENCTGEHNIKQAQKWSHYECQLSYFGTTVPRTASTIQIKLFLFYHLTESRTKRFKCYILLQHFQKTQNNKYYTSSYSNSLYRVYNLLSSSALCSIKKSWGLGGFLDEQKHVKYMKWCHFLQWNRNQAPWIQKKIISTRI